MEFPQRKRQRLRDFDYSSPGVYFITQCIKDGADILGNVCVGDGVLDVPYVELSPIGKLIENQIAEINRVYEHISIDKYVIMPNHIHLIVFLTAQNGTSRTPSPTNQEIPKLMSTLKRFVNRSCGRDIFQRSYHDHIIRNEAAFLKIWQYIDTNPAEWELDCFHPQNQGKEQTHDSLF